MSKCSFQDLWKILIGHSSLRDPGLIKAEVELCAEQLLNGLDHYKKPSAPSLKKLKASKHVKGASMNFVVELSKYLELDELQSLELFESFLSGSYHGSLSDLNQKLSSEREQVPILHQIRDYFYSERLHLLRCLKQLLGFWQDPGHDYRGVYEACLEKISKDDGFVSLLESLWRQYEHCVDSRMPASVQGQSEEGVWLTQVLREQIELLEIILLYYKDFNFLTPDLCQAAKRLQKYGFGQKQHTRVGLVSSAEPLLNHLSHLCSLILIEGIYLEWVEKYKDSPNELSEHHLLNPKYDKNFKELDKVISGWGDQVCHAPVLLAWMAFKFVALPKTDLEQIKSLGNMALQARVFDHLLSILKSPYFSGDRPIASTSKCIVHTLLSLCVSTFNEESLGNPQTLLSIATETLTHPRLRLEFWKQGTSEGVGLLLSSAQESFPLDLLPVLTLLCPLSSDQLSAQSVFSHLHKLSGLTEAVSSQQIYGCVSPGQDEGTWVLKKPRTLYGHESQRLGQGSFTLPVGTGGLEMGEEVIRWSHDYSAWELFALETCQIFHTPGVGTDPSPSRQVERVTEIAKLVTEILKHDWSLAAYLRPITLQYFNIIQTFSPLPNPPVNLLATCLQCVAVITANKPNETWEQLRRTGFLPHLTSTYESVRSLSVAPGHYGQLLNVWERPRGTYPVSMAMLDLLLGMSRQGGGSLSTNEMLACVVYVMKEMLSTSHSWRYRQPTSRDEIGCKLLQLCHNILEQGQQLSSLQRIPVYEYVCYYLLYLVGGRILLNTLAIGVDSVNFLYNTRHSSSQPITQVESLKLAFSIIDLLLQSKQDQSPTPLEQALATQSLKRSVESTNQIHLVAVIASYIHHHDDPHVPAGATNLLVRLSHVAPMSVFACLGQEAVPIRDAFVSRLKAHVEDTELKVAILDLVSASINSQPGMMELFLCVRPRRDNDSKTGKGAPAVSERAAYILESESCLHTILEMIDPKKQGHPPPLSLLRAAMSLLRGLWQGRHDAALIALRSSPHFWENLTKPLLSAVELSVKDGGERDIVHRMAVSSHVMHIVAMEMYYVFKNQMDKELMDVLKKFAKEGCYTKWTKCLQSLTHGEDESMSDGDGFSSSHEVSRAQLELAQAWSCYLLVISTSQEALLQGSTLRLSLLKELLAALESQLQIQTAPTETVVAIATELSMLYTVLLRRWSCDLTKLDKEMLPSFNRILQQCGRIDPTLSVELHSHLYSGLIQVIRTAKAHKESVEPRFVLGLVPYIAETLQNHHLYISVPTAKCRPDVTAVYLLSEAVSSLSSEPGGGGVSWLPVLRHHSLVTVLVRTMDEHLRLRTDVEFIETSLGFFLGLSRTKAGAEMLVVNGVSQSLSISLADALLSMLSPSSSSSSSLAPAGEAQQERRQLHQQWVVLWQLSLKLMSSLLDSLGHQFIAHALDFTGVNQERLVKALNIYEMLKDLSSLKETSCVCQFLSHLSRFKQQWQFSLPSVHTTLLEQVVVLTSSCVALLSNRSNLKQVIKTMNASGVLPQEYGPAAISSAGGGAMGGALGRQGSGRVRTLSASGSRLELDDSWVTTSPAFTELQDSVVLTMTSCLAMLRHYTPSLDSMILEGVLDLAEYPPLFSLSLAPPTLDCTTPPSLATLTTCLSSGLLLLNKLESHKLGTPFRSPSRSPRAAIINKKKTDYLLFLEQAVFLLLSQATRYLIDPSVDIHDKQVLKKELANELDQFSSGLLRNFHRKGLPSPKSATPPGRGHIHSLITGSSLHDSSASSKASSLCFSDSSEQAMFKLADSFAKQFFR